MAPISFASMLRSRFARVNKKIGGMFAFFGKIPSRLKNRHTQNRAILITSRIFFLVLMNLLLACTAIDVLKQSFSSGQFWNSIIVIITFSIIAIWALILSLYRRVYTNRWLAAIPRRGQVGRADIGGKMTNKIVDTRLRCSFLFRNQLDFSTVNHLGAQNPLRKGKGEQDIEVPFWEIADTIPNFFEGNVTIIMPELKIAPGQSLREYIEVTINENILGPGSIGKEINEFLDIYETLRYSGRSISYEELLRMMTALVTLNNHLQQPMDYSQSSSTFGTSTTPASSMASVMIHQDPYTPPQQLHHSGDLMQYSGTDAQSTTNSVYSIVSRISDAG